MGGRRGDGGLKKPGGNFGFIFPPVPPIPPNPDIVILAVVYSVDGVWSCL